MKRLVSIIFVIVLLLVVGTVAADPGSNNPYIDAITNVDCDGSDHDYDLLYTVGLSPWFDPDGTTVSPGPARVEMEVDGEWELLFALPDQGIPTIFCTWTRDTNHFRGDVQFAPPR
jgi:hypothetical protein